MSDRFKRLARTPEGFAVGRDCEAWCGRCKQTTEHTVVALKATGDAPKQVACRSCNDWHAYSKPRHSPQAEADKPARREASASVPRRNRAKRAPESSASAESRWKAAIAATTVQPKDYDYRGSYVEGDVIRHREFGLCIVVKRESSRRSIVLCRDGERALLTPGARR